MSKATENRKDSDAKAATTTLPANSFAQSRLWSKQSLDTTRKPPGHRMLLRVIAKRIRLKHFAYIVKKEK